jgi:hypothetical protein
MDLTATLAAAAAIDERKADLIIMAKNLLSLKRFRPEAVVHEFFAAARNAGAVRYQDWTVFVQLRGDPMLSPPVQALCRVLEGVENMKLPGFSLDTSAAVLAGVRQLMRESGGSFT